MAPLLKLPLSGPWLKGIREGSFLAASQIASKLGVTKAGYQRLERAERTQQISLANLKRCAEALDCDLVYGLVPKDRLPLSRRISDRLLDVALKARVTGLPCARVSGLVNRMYELMSDPEFRASQGWARMLPAY
ncbi:MAG: helix-turn-helix domain-containing protein [Bdellovibrionaceae bacterium]|nr:helix-turn-helix domain-containing protein [Pseudobdellovibrionaceae bacterium]